MSASAPAPMALDPVTREAVVELLLTLADDEFVIGFWDSEWTGIAPILEEDVAMSSISQDEIGHAKAWYELLAGLTRDDPDRIAFGRRAEDYRHAALLNHARGDWAHTVARRLLYETADVLRLESLARSSYAPIAELAAKMRREETYHLLHWYLWLDRLSAAGGEGRERLAASISERWGDAQTIFAPLAGEACLVTARILPEPLETVRAKWRDQVMTRLDEAGLPRPRVSAEERPTELARRKRTADFAWLHSEFTMVARSDEGATW